ncbi:MAG: hypothetical protein H0U65_02845 [Rubrobacter sp.]|jgi:hypothetical protein|nr:hypothetical protein [Rubrobacter sp.]
MLSESSTHPEDPTTTTSYWLIARNDAWRKETLTVGLGKGRKALPIFSFPDEAGLFVRFGGFERNGWRIRESTSAELFSALVEDLPEVAFVALDPLPEMVDLIFGTTISLVTLSRERFIHRLIREREPALPS